MWRSAREREATNKTCTRRVHTCQREIGRASCGSTVTDQIEVKRSRVAQICTPTVYVRCLHCGAAQPRPRLSAATTPELFLWSRGDLDNASKENEGRTTCINNACGATIILDADVKVTFEW